MKGVRVFVGALLMGALGSSPAPAAEKAANEKPAAGQTAPAGGNAAAADTANPPVRIQGDVPLRPELQAFQGVKGWMVNGQQIKLEEVKDRATVYHGPYVLQDMVAEMLLQQEAQRRNVTVTEAETQQKIKDLREEGGLTSDAALDFYLRRIGYTRDWMRQKARDYVLMEKVLGGQVYVSDKEVAVFYDQFRDQYRRPESVDFRVISLPTEKDAQGAIAQIRGVRSFQQVAKDLAPTDEKPLAGELHSYEKGRGTLTPEIEAVLFTAPLDQVVGPIKSGNAYHLFKVEKKRDAYQFSLDEVKDVIKSQLRKQKLEQGVWPGWVEAQLGGAEIEVIKAQ